MGLTLLVTTGNVGDHVEECELYIDDVTLMFFDTLMASLNASFPAHWNQFDFFEYEDEDGERLRVRTDEELATFLDEVSTQKSHPLRVHLRSNHQPINHQTSIDEAELHFEPADLRFIELLSDGQFGSVYKALESSNDRLMAVKCISVDSTSGTRQALLNEIAILKKCSHPNIVQFHAALFVDNQLLICMELMDALSLDRYGQLMPPVLGAVSVAVLDGLKYLWDLHIIHRDIKPSNFLVNFFGQVKLADFGVSKQMAQSVAWSYVGTKVYMAPERLNGDVYSVASDLWSLGVSLAEMALGRFPLLPSGATAPPSVSSVEMLLFEPGRIASLVSQNELSTVGSGFAELLAGCLMMNPKERFKPEQVFQHVFLSAHRPMNQSAVSQFVGSKANFIGK